MTRLTIPAEIAAEIEAGTLFVVNHSGGKDSQAMTALLRELVPAEQIVVVHAELPEVDWSGVLEHIEATIGELELVTCTAASSFFETVERRRMFPTPSRRQCTSDLKRTPIEVVVRRLCKERGISRVVQCLGLRAEESTNRAKATPLKLDKRLSKAGRHVLQWLPIHELEIDEVFATIAAAGQVPHWAYAAGMSRLSCCFCIMGSKADLTTAARLNPELYARYVATEKRLGFTLRKGKSLEEITGIAAVAGSAGNSDLVAEAFLATILEAADLVDAGAGEPPEVVDLVAMADELELEAWLDAHLGPLPKDLPRDRKIAIHGTPVTPRPLLEQLAGKSFCVSYFDKRDAEACAGLVGADEILLLDNGAFSAWTQGLDLDDEYWIGFYDWAAELLERVPQAIAIVPDVIGGTVEDNGRLILECPLPLERCAVVWHLHEPLAYLRYLLDAGAGAIAFGSSGEYARPGAANWRERIAEAFAAIEQWVAETGEPRPFVHMLRGLGQLEAWPFNAADSTNIARNHCRHRGRPNHVADFAARVEAKIVTAPPSYEVNHARRGDGHGPRGRRRRAARDHRAVRNPSRGLRRHAAPPRPLTLERAPATAPASP
jgi:3'-phosphoadenosine 5'-phosphosulfate sulfotransferase (PAPS reductase)/FAD synthetase